MSRSTRWTSLTLTAALCLLLPLGVAAQSEGDEPSPAPVAVPELEGLAWYRAIDTTGTELAETREEAEAAAWSLLVERADATIDELEYDFLEVFDPATLPNLGALATVRVSGAETAALRQAVVQDIIDQAVAAGAEAPVAEEDVIAGKDVAVLSLPAALVYDQAVVYASGDTAWVLLLPADLAEQALGQLP